jgi:hypothetical protein
MPRGSYLFCFAKKGNPKKAESVGDDWPDPAMLRKKRNSPKLATLKQRAVLIAFFFRLSGPINGDPSNRYLIASRCLTKVASIE